MKTSIPPQPGNPRPGSWFITRHSRGRTFPEASLQTLSRALIRYKILYWCFGQASREMSTCAWADGRDRQHTCVCPLPSNNLSISLHKAKDQTAITISRKILLNYGNNNNKKLRKNIHRCNRIRRKEILKTTNISNIFKMKASKTRLGRRTLCPLVPIQSNKGKKRNMKFNSRRINRHTTAISENTHTHTHRGRNKA